MFSVWKKYGPVLGTARVLNLIYVRIYEGMCIFLEGSLISEKEM